MNFRITGRGYTLVELAITVFLVSILAGLAHAGWQSIIERQRVRGAMYGLVNLFQYARSEAVRRGKLITICPLDQNNECSKNWSNPIVVFADPDNEKKMNATPLRQWQPPQQGRLAVAPAWKSYFQYSPTGRVHGTLGNISYCPRSADLASGQLVVSMAGRPRLRRDRDSDGWVEKSDGSPIHCSL